jgi:hypothetical protein
MGVNPRLMISVKLWFCLISGKGYGKYHDVLFALSVTSITVRYRWRSSGNYDDHSGNYAFTLFRNLLDHSTS